MKKRSFFFKVFSLFIAVIISVIGVRTDVFAVNVSTLTYTCQKPLCSKKIICIGPILPGDTIPSSDPVNGGKTYEELWDKQVPGDEEPKDGHVFIILCPNCLKNNAQAILGHSYVIYWYQHNFETTYKQLENDVTESGKTYAASIYHIKKYDCNSYAFKIYLIDQTLAGYTASFSDDLLYGIIESIGSNGCGLHKEEYAVHVRSYGSWQKSNEIQHIRTVKCKYCDYSEQATSSHSFTNSTITSLNDSQHYYTKTCSDCGYSQQVTSNHSLSSSYSSLDSNQHTVKLSCSGCSYEKSSAENHTWKYSDYASKDDETHTYIKSCTKCGYSETVTENHVLGRSPTSGFSLYDSSNHKYTNECSLCDYISENYISHNFMTTYSFFSEEQHSIKSSCECGYSQDIKYGNHHDDDGDCYCDDCGYEINIFSVTVPTTMEIVIDKNGKAYTPTNVAIYNNSTKNVKVSKVSLTGKNEWKVVSYSTNMANEKVDSKKIGIKINGSESDNEGNLPFSESWIIEKDSSLPLEYDAKVSATSSPIAGTNVVDVNFVIDWSDE